MDFNLNAASFISEQNFKSLEGNTIYDVLIIGGGPAGLTSAVYCMRKGMSTGIIIKSIGGQVAETSGIENYLGYRYINGTELVQKFKEQVTQFGIGYDEGSTVKSIDAGKIKKVVMDDGRSFSARSLILATGKSWRRLGVPGEERLTGKGVAYCSICDAPFFKGKKVVVVGGGNSGVESAIDLAKVAEHVTIIQFLEKLTADDVLIKKLNAFENVDILYNHEVVEIFGDSEVTSVNIKDRGNGDIQSVPVQGIFVEIGLVPNAGFVRGIVDLNEHGEIIVDCACRTSAEGIFAAGDVTSVPFKQIIIAGGEGAKAALSAYDYILMK